MEQTRSKGKIAADLALLFFFAVVLILVGSFVPLLGTVAMLLWALPVILAVFRDGTVPAVVLAVNLGTLLILLLGLTDSIMTVGLCCVLGLFYGVRLKDKSSSIPTLLMGMGIGILIAGLYFGLVITSGDFSFENIESSFRQEMMAAYSAYVDSGLVDEAMLEGLSIEAYISDIVDTMMVILPSFYFMVVIFASALNFVVAQAILKKRSYDIEPLPVFREWHLPWWVLWGVVIALALFVSGNYFDLEILRIVAVNILICYAPILMIAGISLVRWLCVAWHLNDGMQALLWLGAAFFLSVSVIFLILTGIADTMLDYRAAAMKKKNNNDGGHEI